jgi:hypothetical protein
MEIDFVRCLAAQRHVWAVLIVPGDQDVQLYLHGDSLRRNEDHVVADTGYDSNEVGERVEGNQTDRPRGRRFLCTANRRS